MMLVNGGLQGVCARSLRGKWMMCVLVTQALRMMCMMIRVVLPIWIYVTNTFIARMTQ
jgi:hypothetical protein